MADPFELDDDGRRSLDDWVVMMQDWTAGILVWHRMSARYPEGELRQRPFAGSLVQGDTPSPPAAKRFVPGPAGLGTETARIASLLPQGAGG